MDSKADRTWKGNHW